MTKRFVTGFLTPLAFFGCEDYESKLSHAQTPPHGLDARLRHAQQERQAPIDLLSALVGDELLRSPWAGRAAWK